MSPFSHWSSGRPRRRASNPVAGRHLSRSDALCLRTCRQPKKFKRQVTYNWKGIAAYAFFCIAFVFYMWIRISKTLNLGAYLACAFAFVNPTLRVKSAGSTRSCVIVEAC